VGPATSKAILAYRASHGRFRSVTELLEVPGIGPTKLEALRPLVKV
jgi:competence protein ComEA